MHITSTQQGLFLAQGQGLGRHGRHANDAKQVVRIVDYKRRIAGVFAKKDRRELTVLILLVFILVGCPSMRSS